MEQTAVLLMLWPANRIRQQSRAMRMALLCAARLFATLAGSTHTSCQAGIRRGAHGSGGA